MAMVDRISTLPDNILCHILSFLSTQYAVSTSLLSKRWRHLWLSLPSLHFHLKLPYSSSIHSNNNFINRILLSRDGIKSLCFRCGPIFNIDLDPLDSDVNEWIDTAIQLGLENLDLGHPYDPPIPTLWSSSIFNCKTLVVLKLEGFFLDVDAFPYVVHLPALKTLHLNYVYFPEPRYVLKLLSGCPILEDLVANCIEYDGPIGGDMEEANGDIIIHCDYDGVSLPKLVNAQISHLTPDIPLKAISSVQFLRIDEYLSDIPVFPNLAHLELEMWVTINWPLVLEMLKQCPRLQVLVLNIAVVELSMFTQVFADLDWPYPQFVPECISSQLRKCSIRYYKDTESSLLFVKYVMQNSRALRSMTIYNAPSHAKLKMLKELGGSSPTCQLSFIN